MNFFELQKLDSQETVDLFNLTVAELSEVIKRQFRRDLQSSYMCSKNGKNYCLPKPLTLSDVRSSFDVVDEKKVYGPIAFYSPPFKKGGVQRHEVRIEYNPQFLYGDYGKDLPEVCVSLYGYEISKAGDVMKKMRELKLQPKESFQAFFNRDFISASLDIE